MCAEAFMLISRGTN